MPVGKADNREAAETRLAEAIGNRFDAHAEEIVAAVREALESGGNERIFDDASSEAADRAILVVRRTKA